MDAGVIVAIVIGAIGLLLAGVLIGRRGRTQPQAPQEPRRDWPAPRVVEPRRRRRFDRGGAMELPEDQEWEAHRNREVAEHYDNR